MNDPERDPFKVYILVVSAGYSVAASVRFDSLTSGALRAFPAPFGRVFLVWLFVLSATALYGIVRQRSVRGIFWERTGMYGIAFLFVTYGAWAWALFGGPATQFASQLIALGVAAMVRVRQINKRRKAAVTRGPT